jgi:hypothetical protein
LLTFFARTLRAVRFAATDQRIPRWLRGLVALGLLPVPGPFDEFVLLLAAVPLALFYRAELAEAWERAGLSGSGHGPLRIEVLYFEGCPNVGASVALVQRVVSELRVDADLQLVEVAGEADAIDHHFLGSPSVRVDGTDVEPGADQRSDYAFACRIYRTESGLAPRPTEEWIRAALAA